VESRLDHHGHQLLKQQLARVGDLDLTDVLCGVAPAAVVLELKQIGLAEESTSVAYVDTVAVGHVEEALLQEAGSAVRNHAVTFHLSETKTTISGSTFSGLSSENLSGASAARMDLITHHMLQALIVGGVEEDHDLEALASEAIVHHLIAVPLITEVVELVRDVLDGLALEGCCVTLVSVQTGNLGQDCFNQMTDCHTRGDSVRIDDHIGHNTFDREGQVFLSVSHSTSSLLSVTTGKLVSDLWRFNRSHLNFHESAHLFV